MTDRIWLKNYPPGVPADIDPGQYASLVELTTEALARHADHKAYVLLDTAITYREVDLLADAFAKWLQAQGFRKGERIALMLPNVPQYPVAILGVLRAGLVVAAVLSVYTAPTAPAPRAVASSPSAWNRRWNPVGANSTGWGSSSPNSGTRVSSRLTSRSTRGRSMWASSRSRFQPSVRSSPLPPAR